MTDAMLPCGMRWLCVKSLAGSIDKRNGDLYCVVYPGDQFGRDPQNGR